MTNISGSEWTCLTRLLHVVHWPELQTHLVRFSCIQPCDLSNMTLASQPHMYGRQYIHHQRVRQIGPDTVHGRYLHLDMIYMYITTNEVLNLYGQFPPRYLGSGRLFILRVSIKAISALTVNRCIKARINRPAVVFYWGNGTPNKVFGISWHDVDGLHNTEQTFPSSYR